MLLMEGWGAQIVALSGTEAGRSIALILVLTSAVAHAVFGAINKGGIDPYLNRGAINFTYGILAAPVAFFLVPWPTPALWLSLFVGYLVHILSDYRR